MVYKGTTVTVVYFFGGCFNYKSIKKDRNLFVGILISAMMT